MNRFLLLLLLLGATPALCLPPDVRPNHWAAAYVQQALENHLLSLESDGRFHGEQKVTRIDVAIALARLAKALQDNTWHAAPSKPVPESVVQTLKERRWQNRPVTRYILASVLCRIGNYVANGITRAPANAKDTAKSEALPTNVSIAVPPTNPAYASLRYLVQHREIGPDSPLLQADRTPITAAQLGVAVAQMVTGLNDQLTSLGHDAQGNTPDASFHKPKGGH
ncbi:MAG TPA: S-layer homology domain-containing protein [Chthonomonas sp.]|jgi:hypothetical protein|uniref:S-layer homology domain-containing protein n=1 Tax=Chthonomonas sp. TaxID=2282153 RepID=UPI002B4ADB66|nr:S-layer homology domain-containing protein [Chthonomonas sp.]HLH79432.1 S-layer homology domain-containing protein [Chthonomonas sp.]